MGDIIGSMAGYVGLGPSPRPTVEMVGNQAEVAEAVFETITRYAAEVAERRGAQWTGSAAETCHQVISVVGGRGTGKTTVLLSVLERLATAFPQALVTPVLCPEDASRRIPLAATLAGAIIDAARSALPDRTTAPRIEGTEVFRSLAWLVDVPETFEVVARDTISPAEYYERVVGFLADARVVPRFRQWVDRVLDFTDRQFMVIPIDDADTVIDRADEICDLFRTYLAHPRLVCLAALDIHEIERRVRNSRLARLSLAPGEQRMVSRFRSEAGESLGRLGEALSESRVKELSSEAAYVRNLLDKVLPPASRFHLSHMSVADKLTREFAMRSGAAAEPLGEVLSRADRALPARHCPDLMPLVEAHPDVLSSNVRVYANQYLQIREAARRHVERNATRSRHDRVRLISAYRRSHAGAYTEEADSARLASPDLLWTSGATPRTSSALIRGQLQLDIARIFLSSGEMSLVADAAHEKLGIELGRLGSFHELAWFFLDRAAIRSPAESRCRYSVLGVDLEGLAANAFVDLCADWCIASGMAVQEVLRKLDVNHLNRHYAFRLVPVAEGLAAALKEHRADASPLLDDCIAVRAGRLDDKWTWLAGISADADRLWPCHVRNARSLGAYAYVAAPPDRAERLQAEAAAFLSGETKDMGKDALYRLLGVVTVQSVGAISALLAVTAFRSDVSAALRSRPIAFEAEPSRSWMVQEMSGLPRVLQHLFGGSEIPVLERLLNLTYVADLPYKVLLACISDPRDLRRLRPLQRTIVSLLDELQSMGLIRGRQPGQWAPGKLDSLSTEAQSVDPFRQVLRDFPYLDWRRRWAQVSSFMRCLKSLQPAENWEPTVEPPPAWVALADVVFPRARRSRSPVRAKPKRPSDR